MLLLAEEKGLTIGDFEIAQRVAEGIELIAIVVISFAVVYALLRAGVCGVQHTWDDAFASFKRYMARGLLIGLDLLIAADIIKTVTFEATIENAVVLGLLVFIRTFLSWTLVLEVEGRWPWQHDVTTSAPDSSAR
jgi:uncharacterized membrane protein